MPGRESRRVGEIGAGQSRYLILPKPWCDGSSVDKGTEVDLLYNGVLVVVPPGNGRTATEILRLMRDGSL
jgi:hypothetical protein